MRLDRWMCGREPRGRGSGSQPRPPAPVGRLAGRASCGPPLSLHPPRSPASRTQRGARSAGCGSASIAVSTQKKRLELLEDVEALREPLLEFGLHRAALHLSEPLELRLDLLGRLALPLSHELGLLLGAARGVVDAALLRERLLDELLEIVEAAATVVVLALGAGLAGEVLDGGVPTDLEFLAEVLARGGAVRIADEHRRRISILGTELVPSRLHRLAMPSPGRKELDEQRLAGGLLVPVRSRQFRRGAGARDEEQREGGLVHD
mmetsp:Transcript_6801/g.15946  ORF Transcript_6801/g.15946 Transcript_6801/m.15946 type:complete len:264 (-) Transcript_6801:11-802(-)